MSERRTLATEYLARVEGEAALTVEVLDGRVQRAELSIFEPPRLFEGLLRGRAHTEAPDLTARICGICPVAYQTSAVNAIEDAAGVEVSAEIRRLRRLLYCGEWIQSHALHIYLLHAPDFLGYAGGLEMARDAPDSVARGLAIKRAGNALIRVVGGREVHPVNVRVGGFYRAPPRRDLMALRDELARARELSIQTARWCAAFTFPERELDCELIALSHPTDYAMERGRIRSDRGLDIAPADFAEHIEEVQVQRSTALQAHRRDGGTYLCGPLARYSLNHAQLGTLAREVARDCGLGETCRNPFQSIIVRSVELVEACDEAVALIDTYTPFDPPAVAVPPRAAQGHGVSEAPRGLLYHRYAVDGTGTIEAAQIVPPTSQNQSAIEADLVAVVQAHLHLDDKALRGLCEQTVRNYDPCISCATHFLDLRLTRR